MENGAVSSYFLYLGGSNVGVVAFDFSFGELYKVAVAFVILRQAVRVAVGAVTALATIAQQSHLLLAEEAAREVRLFRLQLLRQLDEASLVDDLLLFREGPAWRGRYL